MTTPTHHSKRRSESDAIFGGLAPCDGCTFTSLCRERRTACEAFAMFVHSPRRWRAADRLPTSRIYRRLFVNEPLSDF